MLYGMSVIYGLTGSLDLYALNRAFPEFSRRAGRRVHDC